MKQSNVLVKELYPKISKSLDKNTNKFKQLVGRFIEARAKELYDIAPYSRMYFTTNDVEEFYKALSITEKEILEPLSKTYYYPHPNFNPIAAKDPFTVAMIMVIRHFLLHKKDKEVELAMIYLSFSGKFYPSIHHGSFPVVQPIEYKHIMEYVVNHRLNQQFDLKSEGSVMGAIKSRGNTWLNTYQDRFKTCDDEDVVYLIQQLHDRIKSFMKNIAEVYYDVYDSKDSYLTYDSDDLSEDSYHMADNDSLKIERAVEKSMTYISSNSIDYNICTMASDSNVKVDEVKSIIESLLNDNNNLIEIKELIRLLITDYFDNNKNKSINDISFINYSITSKPNSKSKEIIRIREIVRSFLENNSTSYNRRKHRESTKNSYIKATLVYFTLIVYNANK